MFRDADYKYKYFFLIACTLVVAALTALGLSFQYNRALGEPDLYWIVAGILDGHANGEGAKSMMQYGANFSFGYYEIVYKFMNSSILENPNKLISAVNTIGLFSAVLAVVFLICSVSFQHGAQAAFVTAAIFGLSPMILDLATSGHPILPALAAFFLGVALMVYPSAGTNRAILWTVAGLVFLLSLSIRAEVLLAFCWPVVAGADTSSFMRFVRTSAVRVLPPLAATVVFFVAQTKYVAAGSGGGMGSLLDFMQTFYDFRKIGHGLGFFTIGSGFATLALASLCVVLAYKSIKQRVNGKTQILFAYLLEPSALMLPCFAFWLPNPSPARHFLFAILGVSLFIGILLQFIKLKPMHTTLLIVFAVVGNQLIGELLRPVVVRAYNSPYINSPEQPRTTSQAPLGAIWVHHASLAQRRTSWDQQAIQASALCDKQLIVLADEPMHMALALYGNGQPPRLGKARLGPFDAISAIRPNGQEFYFVPRNPYWPRDTVQELVVMPELASFAIWDVPLSRTIHDRTPVPQNRIAKTVCATQD